jgi:co-chaperonin GroES (HSP10)
MGLRLLNSWIVIRDLEPDEKMIGSLHIPEGSVEDPHKWAEVLEVGKGQSIPGGTGWAPSEVQKGDKVLYVRFLKHTDTGKALTPILAREYGAGAFLIQEKDVICLEPAE